MVTNCNTRKWRPAKFFAHLKFLVVKKTFFWLDRRQHQLKRVRGLKIIGACRRQYASVAQPLV